MQARKQPRRLRGVVAERVEAAVAKAVHVVRIVKQNGVLLQP